MKSGSVRTDMSEKMCGLVDCAGLRSSTERIRKQKAKDGRVFPPVYLYRIEIERYI